MAFNRSEHLAVFWSPFCSNSTLINSTIRQPVAITNSSLNCNLGFSIGSSYEKSAHFIKLSLLPIVSFLAIDLVSVKNAYRFIPIKSGIVINLVYMLFSGMLRTSPFLFINTETRSILSNGCELKDHSTPRIFLPVDLFIQRTMDLLSNRIQTKLVEIVVRFRQNQSSK
jgi:hypothetical protein